MNKAQYAYEALKKRILSGAWNEGEQLPVLAVLADECNVSRMTMSRAIGKLCSESLVHMRGTRIMRGIQSAHHQKPMSNGHTWERLKSRIGRDILSGTAARVMLHPLNKAAIHYGVSINTLRKALDKLVLENIVQKKGSRYQEPPIRKPGYSQSIVLISSGAKDYGIQVTDPRTEQVVRCFERDCPRSGHTARFKGFRSDSPNGLLQISESLRTIRNASGYIVNLWDPHSATSWQRWIDLLEFLTARGLPVIALDQEGDLVFPDSLLRAANFRVLRISGIRAGELVAEALLKNQHRQIAYLTASVDARWSQDRYAGLCRFIKQYGAQDSEVELHAVEESTDSFELTLSLMGVNRKELDSLFHERLSKEQIKAIRLRLTDKNSPALKNAPDKATQTIRTISRYLARLGTHQHDSMIHDQMVESIRGISSSIANDSYLAPLFKRIVTSSSASAWVCCDDKPALSSLSFLAKEGIKVPDKISIIGFNDWKESLEQGLSTYNFNMDGLISQAMLMIMDEKYLKSKPMISEVDGYVVERRTTRR